MHTTPNASHIFFKGKIRISLLVKYNLSAIYLEALISEIILFFCLGNPGTITGGSESVS